MNSFETNRRNVCARHFSLTATNCNNNSSSNSVHENEAEKETINNPLTMPDREIELKLANAQATIRESYAAGDFAGALAKSQELLIQTQKHFSEHPATASGTFVHV